jgi:hypothetical protein
MSKYRGRLATYVKYIDGRKRQSFRNVDHMAIGRRAVVRKAGTNELISSRLITELTLPQGSRQPPAWGHFH